MRCICCDFKIKPLHMSDGWTEEDHLFKIEEKDFGKGMTKLNASNRNWDDGVVGNISAGYGSGHDGDMYIIGICDKCATEKIDSGVLIYTGNYMFKNHTIDEKIEKSKILWRRDNNLDEIL